MAATNTFSPDAVLGGPIVHALRGKLDKDTFMPPCQIERGELLTYVRNRTPTFVRGVYAHGTVVVAAEAVHISKSEQIVSVPVVLGGRCFAMLPNDNGTPQSYNSGEKLPGPKDLHGVTLTNGPTFVTIHETNYLKPNVTTPLDVFVSSFSN